MRPHSSRFKSFSLEGLALVLAVCFSACKDDDNDYPQPQVSAIAVFNAATDTEDLNFSLNGEKINEDLLAVGDHIDYLEGMAGTYAAEVTTKEEESLLKGDVKLENQKVYSLFIVNDNEELELVKFEDDLSSPSSGKAKIRFVHVSPDAGKLNLADSQADAEFLFEDRDFKTASSFKEINASVQSLDVIDQVSSEVIFTIVDQEFKAGEAYTVWVKGLRTTDNEDDKFEAVIYKNR